MRISDSVARPLVATPITARPAVAPRRLQSFGDSSFTPSPLGDPNASKLLGLTRGNVGTDGRIKQLQDDLIRGGYLSADVRSNSGYGNTFGPMTQTAVTKLQAAYGLPQTGRIDAATAAALGGASVTPPVVNPPVVTPPVTPPPAAGTGVATSVDQANQSFLSQWGGTPFNSASGAPYGYEDCGPTSVAMSLSQLGLIQHPSPADAELTIDHMRDQAFGYDTTKSQDTNDSELQKALAANGAQGTVVKPVSLASVDQAIANGHPMIVGTGTTWSAWGSKQNTAGAYLNHQNPGGHYVTVMGKAADGNYIVGDPLSKVGALEVTPRQLQTALSGAWDGLEVSKK